MKQTRLIISIIAVLAYSATLSAKTEVLFSPQGKISEKIIGAIETSTDSIDIAVFTFTAGDIASALLSARGRGVEVRIVIDDKHGKKEHPILDFLKDADFELRYLKGSVGGSMHNTYAIIDNKLVITGSYNWTEHSEKYNHENAIFIDEPDVIARYRGEFESLFHKSGKQDGKKDSVPASKEAADTQLTYVTPDNFTDISFSEFDGLFGKDSKLEKAERNTMWRDTYKGMSVRWTGNVHYKGISLYDWNKVGISHGNGEDADVLIKFNWKQRLTVRSLKIGQRITYTGKLDALKGFTSTYKLVDCNVVK